MDGRIQRYFGTTVRRVLHIACSSVRHGLDHAVTQLSSVHHLLRKDSIHGERGIRSYSGCRSSELRTHRSETETLEASNPFPGHATPLRFCLSLVYVLSCRTQSMSVMVRALFGAMLVEREERANVPLPSVSKPQRASRDLPVGARRS